MNVEETFRISIDGDWIEDVDTEEEVKEIIENWINGIDYLEDEELDLVFESVVSRITIELVITDTEDELSIAWNKGKKKKKETDDDIFLYNPPL